MLMMIFFLYYYILIIRFRSTNIIYWLFLCRYVFLEEGKKNRTAFPVSEYLVGDQVHNNVVLRKAITLIARTHSLSHSLTLSLFRTDIVSIQFSLHTTPNVITATTQKKTTPLLLRYSAHLNRSYCGALFSCQCIEAKAGLGGCRRVLGPLNDLWFQVVYDIYANIQIFIETEVDFFEFSFPTTPITTIELHTQFQQCQLKRTSQ